MPLVSAPVHELDFEVEEPSLPSRAELDKALEKYPHKDTLKFGDLISNTSVVPERNDGLSIFDGQKIIDLSSFPDDYGNLPKMFRVLEPLPEVEQKGDPEGKDVKEESHEVIPITYWHNEEAKRCVSHNSVIWFDHRRYKKELLENMRYDTSLSEDQQYAFSTSFVNVYDGETYHIVLITGFLEFSEVEEEPYFDWEVPLPAEVVKKAMDVFKKIIESDELPVFNCDTVDNCPESKFEGRTIYLDPRPEEFGEQEEHAEHFEEEDEEDE